MCGLKVSAASGSHSIRSVFFVVVSLFVAVARGGDSSHGRNAIDELCPIEHGGVFVHAVLERYNNKLTLFEVILQHCANVLRVGEVEGGVHLVKNVNRCRFQQQHR